MSNTQILHNAHQRSIDVYPERANLFPLTVEPPPSNLFSIKQTVQGRTREFVFFEQVPNSNPTEVTPKTLCRAIQNCFLEGLKEAKYTVSSHSQKIIKRDSNLAPQIVGKSIQIYSAFDWQVLHFNSNYYLCLEHRLVVRATLALTSLLKLIPSLTFNPEQRAYFKNNGEWDEGKLMEATDSESVRLSTLKGDEVIIPKEEVYPDLTRNQITLLAPKLKVTANELERSIKQLSLLTIANPARARFDICSDFAAQLTYNVFPLSEAGITVELDPVAVTLRPPRFVIGKNLQEPDVSFDHVDQTKRAKIILSGLVKFGAYDKPSSKIRLVTFSTHDSRIGMERLVQRLNNGSKQYPGAKKTFGSEITVNQSITCSGISEYEESIRQFVRTEIRKNTDLALIYLPKDGDISNPNHPYYKVKAALLKEGIASQMVDRATVSSPDYRDLNLALNIYAKAGNTPWVLDQAIPEVDLFIGLSYSERLVNGKTQRMMSYVNVFDAYGRWKFYQGDAKAFPFEDRIQHYGELVKNSIAMYRAENDIDINKIHIHLTKKFSKAERIAITNAVREVAPNSSVIFVSINSHHNVRLFDLSEGNDGSISRATYLRNDPNRLYLATTGANIFNTKGMGTPIPLELTIWAEPFEAMPDLGTVAQQILSLTRLNWSSSRNFCHEPITTKFAGDIAKKMTAFIDDPNFTVNPNLRNTPWFL